MIKPKITDHRHWQEVSDEELLGKELTTDNPLGLDGLVTQLPEGPEEPHVEFSYNLTDEVRCVHGNHRHKQGFVFCKGDRRYLVGWMCGERIYGQKFNQYTADFNEARSRRDTLVRARDLQTAVMHFSEWATGQPWISSIDAFDTLRESLRDQMPVVFNTVQTHAGRRLNEATMPRYLCYADPEINGDPRRLDISQEYDRFLHELRSIVRDFTKPPSAVAMIIGNLVDADSDRCRPGFRDDLAHHSDLKSPTRSEMMSPTIPG
jgi:hypothetical protein